MSSEQAWQAWLDANPNKAICTHWREAFGTGFDATQAERDSILDAILVLIAGYGFATPERTYKHDGGWGLALSDLKDAFSQLRAERDAAQARGQEAHNALATAFGQLVNISLLTDLGGEVDDYAEVTASVKRLSDERDAAQAALAAVTEAMGEEWVYTSTRTYPVCPDCHVAKGRRHLASCYRGRFFAALSNPVPTHTALTAARIEGVRLGLEAAARAFKGNLATVKRIRAIDPAQVADAQGGER